MNNEALAKVPSDDGRYFSIAPNILNQKMGKIHPKYSSHLPTAFLGEPGMFHFYFPSPFENGCKIISHAYVLLA